MLPAENRFQRVLQARTTKCETTGVSYAGRALGHNDQSAFRHPPALWDSPSTPVDLMTRPHSSRWWLRCVKSCLCLLLLGLPHTVHSDSADKKNPYTGSRAAIEEGERLFHQLACPACHGENGEGAVGPSLTDDQWRYVPTDQTLFDTISDGRRGTLMPPWKDKLSPDQIWKIIAYIRSIYRGDPTKVVW